MVAPYKTGVPAHDAAVYAARLARDVAAPPGSSQQTYKSADITYARACFNSSLTNNSAADAALYSAMLRSLGVGT